MVKKYTPLWCAEIFLTHEKAHLGAENQRHKAPQKIFSPDIRLISCRLKYNSHQKQLLSFFHFPEGKILLIIARANGIVKYFKRIDFTPPLWYNMHKVNFVNRDGRAYVQENFCYT